jgi:DNA-binding GntR family transcriptional regulator
MTGKFTVLAERKPLSDLAYDAIYQRILSGEIRPGERLNEVHVAAQMGISRAPVREAIQRLRQKGLVNLIQNKTPTVIELDIRQVREVYTVRIALEQTALGALAPDRGAALAAELSAVIAGLKDHARAGRVSEVVEEDIRFHEIIVAAAGNSVLNDVYHSLLARVRMILAIDKSAFVDLEEIADGHAEIIDAIARADYASAKTLLSEHIWSSLPIIEAHPAFA